MASDDNARSQSFDAGECWLHDWLDFSIDKECPTKLTRSASFDVAQFSREATVADSCGRQPAEIGGKEFKAAKRRQQFVAAVAASRLCVPFPFLSVGFRTRLSAFAASAAENCATSKSASEGEAAKPDELSVRPR
jgi:hypothetical protein